MQDLELKLDGKHPSQNWNNVLNASMHLMVKWSDTELKAFVAPTMDTEKWQQLNPKDVGVLIQDWFEALDDENLESRTELEQSLIPTAGKYLSASLPVGSGVLRIVLISSAPLVSLNYSCRPASMCRDTSLGGQTDIPFRLAECFGNEFSYKHLAEK
jgi:hypothetical protein